MPTLIIMLLATITYFKRKEVVRMIIRIYNWHVYIVCDTTIGNTIFLTHLYNAFLLFNIYHTYTIDDFYNLINFIVTDNRVKYFLIWIFLVEVMEPLTIESLLYNAYIIHLYFLNHPRMEHLIYIVYVVIIQVSLTILHLYWIGFISHPILWLISWIYAVIVIGLIYY